MSEALVTIGIPCFNSARWLQSTIESALAQTWKNREIIVVDDGSLDHSKVIASAFGDHIRLITSDHYGATYARNLDSCRKRAVNGFNTWMRTMP